MSVAVIGYSCILPGGENVSESWDMINDGLNNIKDLPHDRTDITTYWDPNPSKEVIVRY
jgi:polyketide synthase PksN